MRELESPRECWHRTPYREYPRTQNKKSKYANVRNWARRRAVRSVVWAVSSYLTDTCNQTDRRAMREEWKSYLKIRRKLPCDSFIGLWDGAGCLTFCIPIFGNSNVRSLDYLRNDWAKVVLSWGGKRRSEPKVSIFVLNKNCNPMKCNPGEWPKYSFTSHWVRGTWWLSCGNYLSHSQDSSL